MGLGKSFIAGLIILIAVSFFGWLVELILTDDLDNFLIYLTDFNELFVILFGSLSRYPGYLLGGIEISGSEINTKNSGLVNSLLAGSLDPVSILLFVFSILAPVLAALVAGALGNSKFAAFGGWFFVVFVSLSTLFIMNTYDESILIITILTYIAILIVNTLFYGAISLLIFKNSYIPNNKPKYKSKYYQAQYGDPRLSQSRYVDPRNIRSRYY